MSRRLPAGQEARIAGHLPDLPKHTLGRFQDRETDIGADVEDAGLQRREALRFVHKGDHLVFFSSIESTAMQDAPGRLSQRRCTRIQDLARRMREVVRIHRRGGETRLPECATSYYAMGSARGMLTPFGSCGRHNEILRKPPETLSIAHNFASVGPLRLKRYRVHDAGYMGCHR